jgi:small GTP-binding protein
MNDSTTELLNANIATVRTRTIELVTNFASRLAEIDEDAQEDRQRLTDIASDLREMFFIVAIIGEFNAGKSTLINALLGEELLPMGITPTTEYIELIRYNETAQRIPEIRADGLRQWAHPNTGANGVAIVDTPGTGSIFQKHENTAKNFLHRSDLVLFVISAKRAFADTERLYLELAKNYGKKIILVINQVDLLKPDEQQEVRRFIESQVKETLELEPLIFMLSAKQALQQIQQGESPIADDGGLSAVRAHLRGVYSQRPPARQKLQAQIETAQRILKQHLDAVIEKNELVSLDVEKVRDVQSELTRQSLGLETQMKEAGNSINEVLEAIRQRGLNFIDTHLTIRQVGRSLDRERLKQEFQEVVVGRSLRDINESANDYINAVVDQSRLYWRNVIDRLNRLQDLMEQELTGLDSGIYAEQRASLQEAIRIAEAELKSYSTGTVVSDLESVFKSNLNGFQGGALVGIGGLATMFVASILTPGPLLGAAAAPLAFPAFIGGAMLTAIGMIPAGRYLRRLSRETKQAFNERIDLLVKNYETALDNLTTKERNRLTRYGNQILTPIFSRLEVLAERYAQQRQDLEAMQRELDELHERIIE